MSEREVARRWPGEVRTRPRPGPGAPRPEPAAERAVAGEGVQS